MSKKKENKNETLMKIAGVDIVMIVKKDGDLSASDFCGNTWIGETYHELVAKIHETINGCYDRFEFEV